MVSGWRSWEGGAEEASADSLGKQHPALRRLRIWGKNPKEPSLIGELIRAGTYAKTQVEGSGLYPKIARINHSCAPNSIWTWVARDRSRRRKEVRSGHQALKRTRASKLWKYLILNFVTFFRRISNDLQVRACRKIRKGEEVRTQTLSSWKNNLTLILNQTNHLGNPLTNILCDGPGFFFIHPTRRCLLNKVFYLNETMMHWHWLKENVKDCPNVKGRKRRKAEELVSSLCLPCLLRTGSEAWTQWSDKKRTGCTSQSSIFEILQI